MNHAEAKNLDALIDALESAGDVEAINGAYAAVRAAGATIAAGPRPQALDRGWNYRRMYDAPANKPLFEIELAWTEAWQIICDRANVLPPKARWNLGRLAILHLSEHFPDHGRPPSSLPPEGADASQAAVLLWWKQWLDASSPTGPAWDDALSLTWLCLGGVLCRNWQYAAGAECFATLADATACDYYRLAARVSLAGALVTSGRVQEVAAVVDKCLAADYRDGQLFTELLLWHARALRNMGKVREAERLAMTNLHRARALLNLDIARSSMLFLGRTYLRQGRLLAMVPLAMSLARMAATMAPRLIVQRLRRIVGRPTPASTASTPEINSLAALQPQSIHRIAVARIDGLGDLVLSLGAMRLLRAQYPAARIDMFVARPWGPAARCSGVVDNVYEVSVDRRGLRGMPAINERYDLSIDLMYHARCQQEALMRAIPARVRLGHATPSNLRECDILCPPPPYRVHCSDMNLRLLAQIGIRPSSPQAALPRLDRSAFTLKGHESEELTAWAAGQALVGIHPGAGWPLRKWYPERFAAVADHLASGLGCRIVVIGSAADGPMVDEILINMSAGGRKVICRDLDSLAAVLASLRMLVCNDSGPMHMAGALGVPMTVIWGPGDYEQFSPRGSQAVVIRRQPVCAPCCQEGQPSRCGMGYAWREVACLKSITTKEVCEAAEKLLAETK